MYDKKKAKDLLKLAKKLHKDEPDWYTMSNAIFGNNGPCAKAFPNRSERQAFLEGPEYKEIKKLMLTLSMPHESVADGEEASGKFVVRVPQSMHAALQVEAKNEGVSLNQLVLSKLAIGLGKSARMAIEEAA